MFKGSKVPNPKTFKPQWSAISSFVDRRPAREFLIFIAFCFLTVLMTWPWVLHLRDAVADRGDPYMISWTLWWDYHQTFHNPLHLFDANVFYPYRYTLAFSENDYGVALLLFPLFAAGLKPLTVNSIATFLAFAFCGYGAFRVTRTLTGRSGPAWIAGIVFAFIPFRFHLLSHLHYLFAGWIPLMLESVVLFARKPTRHRATWMGITFFMNGLSCISWFIMTIVPLVLTVIFFVIARKSLLRNREFWLRGSIAIAIASLALAPFLWPYYRVSVLYGFRWQPWEFAMNSPSIIHWFKAEPRNRVWHNFGATIAGGHMLFPGMLAPLLAMAALQFGNQFSSKKWIERFSKLLDFVIVAAAVIATLALGYGDRIYTVFGLRVIRLNDRSVHEASAILIFAIGLKIGLWLVSLIRRSKLSYAGRANPQTDPKFTFTEAIGVGAIWAVAGFLSSLGANFFFNRWLHDYLFLYQSIRIPSRAAMVCYLGLAILAGIGSLRIADGLWKLVSHRRLKAGVFVVIALAVLFELHASPLKIESGEVNPSALALRLKQTPMRGGLVELPSTESDLSRHFYMLRAADHGRPLVNATSSFISPLTDQINKMTVGTIAPGFIDLLEKIPASYLVIHNDRLLPGWQAEYEIFLTRALVSGRLRFINRFDGHDDLYALVMNEPDARSEATPPFSLTIRDLSVLIREDPVNLVAVSPAKFQTLYRIYLASEAAMPRNAEFMKDAESIARGVTLESEDRDQIFDDNLRKFTEEWTRTNPFVHSFGQLTDMQFVDKLLTNAGIQIDASERAILIDDLLNNRDTRAGALLRIVNDQRFVEKENDRSLLLLYYFAYLRRNPDAPPDRDLGGFNFWLKEMGKRDGIDRISLAFQNSTEYLDKPGNANKVLVKDPQRH